MEEKGKYMMVKWISIPLAIVLGDGAVKECAEKKLADGKEKDLFGGRIRLRLLHNDGVALGALGKKPKLVLVMNSALLGAAFGELVRMQKAEKRTLAKTGLALLIGGGASNLVDRMQRGYVTDYFSIHAGERFKKLQKIVFNCSDFCVFAGVLLYVLGKSDQT